MIRHRIFNLHSISVLEDKKSGRNKSSECLYFAVFLAKSGIWLHHFRLRLLHGQGPRSPLPYPRREEDRPQARHTKVKIQRGQNQENICWGSQSGDLIRGGQEIFQSVR